MVYSPLLKKMPQNLHLPPVILHHLQFKDSIVQPKIQNWTIGFKKQAFFRNMIFWNSYIYLKYIPWFLNNFGTCMNFVSWKNITPTARRHWNFAWDQWSMQVQPDLPSRTRPPQNLHSWRGVSFWPWKKVVDSGLQRWPLLGGMFVGFFLGSTLPETTIIPSSQNHGN